VWASLGILSANGLYFALSATGLRRAAGGSETFSTRSSGPARLLVTWPCRLLGHLADHRLALCRPRELAGSIYLSG